MNALMLAKKLSGIYRLAGYAPRPVERVATTTGTSFGNVFVEEGDFYFQVNRESGTKRLGAVVGVVIVHKNLEIDCSGFGHAESGRELCAVLGR